MAATSRAERRARKRKFHQDLRNECIVICALIERRLPNDFPTATTARLVELVIELREAKRRYLKRVMEDAPGVSNLVADRERERRWFEATGFTHKKPYDELEERAG